MKKIISILLFIIILYITPVLYNVSAVVPIGNYLILNGGYVKTTTSSNFSPAAITIEAWINPSATSAQRPIVSIGDPNNAKLHYKLGLNGGSLMLDYLYGIGSRRVITSGFIPVNTWSHVAVTISSSGTRLFINGNQVFATEGASGLLSIGSSIVVGSEYTAGSGNIFIFPGGFGQQAANDSNFTGNIDELRISTTNRDIAGLWQSGAYQNGLPADINTYLLYHLDSNRGETTAIDSSGNSVNGNLTGGDNLIHYFGVLPTPTHFQAPNIINRWVLPTLPSIRNIQFPISNPTPTSTSNPRIPTPTSSGNPIYNPRENRPVFER